MLLKIDFWTALALVVSYCQVLKLKQKVKKNKMIAHVTNTAINKKVRYMCPCNSTY